jgi:hypothetical protein
LCVVLSVAKLTPGQEHYESSVAQGLDGYYAGRGESALAAESGGAIGCEPATGRITTGGNRGG